MNGATETKKVLWKGMLVCGLVFLVVFGVYFPVLDGQFLWDDSFLVQRNPLIRSPMLVGEVFNHFLFIDSPSAFYRPVQNISYIFDYWRSGLSSSNFHQTNLAIHALNGFLLFCFTRKILSQLSDLHRLSLDLTSLFFALVWVVHPVHSAIAAYISGRADSLALAGILAGWLCWENATGKRHQRRTWVSFLTFGLAFCLTLLGLCSKEIGAMGLVLFLTYLWGFREDLDRPFRGKATCAVTLLFGVYLLLRQLPENIAGGSPPYQFSWWTKGELFLRAMGDYGRLLVFPDRLFMERQVTWPNGLLVDSAKVDPLFRYLTILGVCWIILFAASIFWKASGRKLRLFGGCWFFIMILPVSNIIPLNATVAEHWLYIPSIGFLFWLVGCWLPWWTRSQRAVFCLATVALIALSARAYFRAKEWTDPITFFRSTIASGGDSARMRMNLAAEYWALGKGREVEAIYRSLLITRPNNSWIQGLLAQVLLSQGKKEEADELSRKASQHQSGAQNEQAVLIDYLVKRQDFKKATEQARHAYELAPDSWLMASTLAAIYEEQNRPEVALQIVKGYVGRHWWSAESQNQLGRLYGVTGKIDLALAAYRMAARLDTRDAEPYNQSAALLASVNRVPEAISIQEKALQRDSGIRQTGLMELLRQSK